MSEGREWMDVEVKDFVCLEVSFLFTRKVGKDLIRV